VILANPRQTGRQTWNRRAADTDSPAATPALSAKAAHPALITEQDFIAAQQIGAARPTIDGHAHRFTLAGLIHCGVCSRRLDSHWNHGRATYRCRHGHTTPERDGHVVEVWHRRCVTQERSSSTTAPDGACSSAGRWASRRPPARKHHPLDPREPPVAPMKDAPCPVFNGSPIDRRLRLPGSEVEIVAGWPRSMPQGWECAGQSRVSVPADHSPGWQLKTGSQANSRLPVSISFDQGW
jgi:hypothetical protein